MKMTTALFISMLSTFTFAQEQVQSLCEVDVYLSENISKKVLLGKGISKNDCEERASFMQQALMVKSFGYQSMFFKYTSKGNISGQFIDRNHDLKQNVKLLKGAKTLYDLSFEKGFESVNKLYDEKYDEGFESVNKSYDEKYEEGFSSVLP